MTGSKHESLDLNIQPVTFDEACEFVADHHPHYDPPQGWKFGCAVNKDGEEIVGVVIVGRPTARHYQDGWPPEVTRGCTDDTKKAASKHYGAVWRATRALGYKRLVTYTMADE